MLKRKPAKCATPSIKELLDALDLEERNENRIPDHTRPPMQAAHAPTTPPGPWPADGTLDPRPGGAQRLPAHRYSTHQQGIAGARAPHQVWPAQHFAPTEVVSPNPQMLRAEPLRPVTEGTPAPAALNDEALVRRAGSARTSGLMAHAVAIVGALIVMVPSAFYLAAPLLWPGSTPASAPQAAGTAKLDDTKSTKRPLAVASVAVVPVAAPRAEALGGTPMAASGADFDRFTALSNGATSMHLPSAISPPATPEPAPSVTAQPARPRPATVAALVPHAQPTEPAAAATTTPTAIDRSEVQAAAPSSPALAPIATATRSQVPATATGAAKSLAIAVEPLRARVPLTALSADPPTFVVTTRPTAATAIVTSPSKAAAPPTPKDSITAARATILIERGRQLAALGDIAGARVLYELAAKSGNEEGKRLFEEILAPAASVKSAANIGSVAPAATRTRPEGASALGAPGAGETLRQSQATPAN